MRRRGEKHRRDGQISRVITHHLRDRALVHGVANKLDVIEVLLLLYEN